MPNRRHFFEQLFLHHGNELLIFARQSCGDDFAEDLVQDTYARFLQQPNPESIQNPRAYLYKTAANLSVDNYRRQQSLDRFLGKTPDEENEYAETDVPAALTHLPDVQIELREKIAALNAALLELPQAIRYAFLLYRLEGLSHLEISRRLGISVRKSERYIAQASRHILEFLDDAEV